MKKLLNVNIFCKGDTMLNTWDEYALYKFNKFISSCSYYLMQLRINKKGIYYKG